MKASTKTIRAVRMPDLRTRRFERFKPVATTVPAACRQRPCSAVTREGFRRGREPRHRPRQCESLRRLAQADDFAMRRNRTISIGH
jgi:hypothetical protein